MAVTPRTFSESTQLTASAATYVAAVVGAKIMIDKFTVYNSDTVPRTVTVHMVPSAGTAGATNIILVKTLQTGETYTCPEVVGHVLEPGAFIQALASTAAVVNLRVSGRLVS
jgi:hypothetical protein